MNTEIRKVFSLNLICYLRCNKFKENSVGFNKDTKKVYFIYDDNKELDRVIKEYKRKDTQVKLHDFIAEFKKLKEEMYQHLKEFTKS